jgi:predicted RNA-binding protein YlqC (UPF0109 family)
MKDLLALLVEGLVDEPTRVSVRERTEGRERTFEVQVARGDRGRVIGRNGKTAAALRTLMSAVAERRGETVTLEIRE